MKVLIPLLLLSIWSASSPVDGFLQEFIPKAFTTNPKHLLIDQIIRPTTEALVGQDLEVRLEVGQKNSAQRMSIQQLLLHLEATEHHPTTTTTTRNIKNTNVKIAPTTAPASLSGRSSTSPAAVVVVDHHKVIPLTTTGKSDIVHSLTVQKSGSFINHAGLQVVGIDPDTAVWELIWDSPTSPAGTLVLGLDVQQDATRNDATLKKGHIFISFPVWTKDGITEYQQRKAEVELAANVHLVERDVQIQKFKEATNLFAKLVHYRNAAAAVERYSLYPTRAMASIPDDDDLIPLANGSLFLTKTGTIWRNPTSNTFFTSNQPEKEGSASIKVKVAVPPVVTPPKIHKPLAAVV